MSRRAGENIAGGIGALVDNAGKPTGAARRGLVAEHGEGNCHYRFTTFGAHHQAPVA